MKQTARSLAAGLLVVIACSDDAANDGAGAAASTTTSNAGGAGSTMTGFAMTSTTTASTNASQGSGPGGGQMITACQNHVYQCGDLMDNDGDGLIDAFDPDCLGPCDNTEDSFFGGIPGQNNAPCKMDCYFDQDTGDGNDDCSWDHRCDPNEVAPGYYPEPERGAQCEYDPDFTVKGRSCVDANASQSDACADYCGPLTPNGCDCFGCCELPAGGGKFVWLGSQGADGNTVCTMDKLADPTVCHPCLPVQGCFNDCAPCEVCIGKPLPDPGCGEGGGGGGGGEQCPGGEQACGLQGQAPCPSGSYCVTGCCQVVPS